MNNKNKSKETPTATMKVKGVIVARRSMGKNLAFAEIAPLKNISGAALPKRDTMNENFPSEGNYTDGDASANIVSQSDIDGYVRESTPNDGSSPEVVKVVFLRQAFQNGNFHQVVANDGFDHTIEEKSKTTVKTSGEDILSSMSNSPPIHSLEKPHKATVHPTIHSGTPELNQLNDGFPTKSSDLPYGAVVEIALSQRRHYPTEFTNNGSGKRSEWEVRRWRIVEHPREIANRLASLTTSYQYPVVDNDTFMSSNAKEKDMMDHVRGAMAKESAGEESTPTSLNQQMTPVTINDRYDFAALDVNYDAKHKQRRSNHNQSHKPFQQQNQILGSGAMSCSTYLKIRGEAYQMANQHRVSRDNIINNREKETTKGNKNSFYRDSGVNDKIKNDLPSHVVPLAESNKGLSELFTPASAITKVSDVSLNSIAPKKVKMETSKMSRNCHHGDKFAKALRAKIFAAWILDTFFGIENGGTKAVASNSTSIYSKINECTSTDRHSDTFCQPCSTSSSQRINGNAIQSSHILDIAGGKGQLSMELIVQQLSSTLTKTKQDNIAENENLVASRCTIIDPMVRKGDAKHRQAKLKRAVNHIRWQRQELLRKHINKRDKEKRQMRLDEEGDHRRSKIVDSADTLVCNIINESDNAVAFPNFFDAGHHNLKNGQDDLESIAQLNENKSVCNLDHATNNRKTIESQHDNKKNKRNNSDPTITHIATHFTAHSFPSLYSQFLRPTQEQIRKQKDTLLSQKQYSTIDSPNISRLLLLGLHPDECTEDILDVALEHNLSVAIVPCCVFPDLFPDRWVSKKRQIRIGDKDHKEEMSSTLTEEAAERNENGENYNKQRIEQHNAEKIRVRTYNEFLSYLMSKDDGLKLATLPFEGKNVVIYKKVDV